MNNKSLPSQPLVSVVIPTYNRSNELARAIQSVLNQTHQHFEILVVDDGSEENLKNVCDNFSDQRILFLRNETHTNANVARNRGIKEAKSEYIAMLDSDDEFLPTHLERRLQKMREWKCDGIFGSAYINNEEGSLLKLSRPINNGELIINYLLSDGFAPTPSHFYKANAAKQILWDETLFRHQDYDFSVRFADKFDFRSDYEPTTIINWAQHEYIQNNPERINSIKKFINSNINSISTNILINYCLKTINLLKIENCDKGHQVYFKKVVLKNMSSISFNTYSSLQGTSPFYRKIINRILFSIKVLLNF